MKAEGCKFPALNESDAMFSADTAPEWADGDCCHRCRVQFGVVQRKHHCRACGQVFCAQCSSKTSTVPKFGFEKEVRVCDACYDVINRPSTSTAPSKSDVELPPEYVSSSLAQQNQAPPRKTEEELREEEELQLALALSQSEAEHKEKEKKRTATMMSSAAANRARTYSPPPSTQRDASPAQDDPELAHYLNRALWNQRKASAEKEALEREVTSPSAPANTSSPLAALVVKHKQENGEVDADMEDFVINLKSQVEIFVNRMKSNSSRGRSIANDSSVQTLFMTITAMHSRLLRYSQQQDDKRVYFEGLQDKLTQVKDARAALNALREEHQEKLRRQAEEAERIRQLQMAHKLEIMRKKKQEYLQYQRELAIRRIQEQEREMQMRQEQQRQQYMMSGIPYPMQHAPPGFAPGVDGAAVHGQFGPGQMMPGSPYPTTSAPGTLLHNYQPPFVVAGMTGPPVPGQNVPVPMQGSSLRGPVLIQGHPHPMMRGPMMPGQMGLHGHLPGPMPGPGQPGSMHSAQGPMPGPGQVMPNPAQVPMPGQATPGQQSQMQHGQGPMPAQGQQGPMQHGQGPMPAQGQQGPMQHGQGPMPAQGQQGPMQHGQGPMPAQGQQGPMQHGQGPMPGPGQQGPMQHGQGPMPGPGQHGPVPMPGPGPAQQVQGPRPLQHPVQVPQAPAQPPQGQFQQQQTAELISFDD
ncbi:hepatocyte growth factor-regulated tyrosine kinase substrate isoform X2 [Bacillus rossius redtenbacheri]